MSTQSVLNIMAVLHLASLPEYIYLCKNHVQLYEFWKKEISDDAHEKEEMMKKLSQFKVSLTQYRKAFEMENVTM